MVNFINEDFEEERWVIPPLNHKSHLSEIMWNFYAAGSQTSWINGEISLQQSDYVDPPYLLGFPKANDGHLVSIDWINNLIELLDIVIPSSEQILSCLDDDILTLRLGASAYKMPSSPTPKSAAECLVSSRVMARSWMEVIPPDLVSNERAARWFDQASILSLLLGGEETFLLAMEIASNPQTYAINFSPRVDPLVFEGEE